MLRPFTLARTPSLVFGKFSINKLNKLASQYGSRVLIVHNNNSESLPHWDKVQESLTKSRLEIRTLLIDEDPGTSLINEACAELSSYKPEVVVAIGDRRAINAGKSVSAMIEMEGANVEDYLDGFGLKKHPGTKLPFITVPTYGTGAESDNSAMLTSRGKIGYRKPLKHWNFIPEDTVLDADLSIETTVEERAFIGLFVFNQLISSFTAQDANVHCDTLALSGFHYFRKYYNRTLEDIDDKDAVLGMMYAAYLSGICSTNVGVGTAYGFGSSVGSVYDIEFEKVGALMMAKTHRETVNRLRAGEIGGKNVLQKYAQIGKLYTTSAKASTDQLIDGLLNKLEEISSKLPEPTLSNFGVVEESLEKIAKRTSNMENPADLSVKELQNILQSCL